MFCRRSFLVVSRRDRDGYGMIAVETDRHDAILVHAHAKADHWSSVEVAYAHSTSEWRAGGRPGSHPITTRITTLLSRAAARSRPVP